MPHEPHCPVPRAAERGEGAVCLCPNPEIYLVFWFSHDWKSEHDWVVRGSFFAKSKAIEFAKTLCQREDDQAVVIEFQINTDHPNGGKRIWNDYSWKHPKLGTPQEDE